MRWLGSLAIAVGKPSARLRGTFFERVMNRSPRSSDVAMADVRSPVLVLDNNILRDEAFIRRIVDRYRTAGQQVALPMMVMFELTKHRDDWEKTVRRSFEYIVTCPDAFVVTRTAKDLALAEETSGEPTQQVVDEAMTDALRTLLADIQKGEGPDLDYFRWAVPNFRDRLRYDDYETDSRSLMKHLRNIAKTTFPRTVVARIGDDLAKDDRRSFRQLLVDVNQIDRLRDAHVRRGVAERHADALLSAPSVSYLFALAVGSIALEWTFRGGIDTATPRRVANDVLDIEYAIPALWIGRLVAEDNGARERFEDLKILGAATWPSHHEWFGRAEANHPADL